MKWKVIRYEVDEVVYLVEAEDKEEAIDKAMQAQAEEYDRKKVDVVGADVPEYIVGKGVIGGGFASTKYQTYVEEI